MRLALLLATLVATLYVGYAAVQHPYLPYVCVCGTGLHSRSPDSDVVWLFAVSALVGTSASGALVWTAVSSKWKPWSSLSRNVGLVALIIVAVASAWGLSGSVDKAMRMSESALESYTHDEVVKRLVMAQAAARRLLDNRVSIERVCTALARYLPAGSAPDLSRISYPTDGPPVRLNQGVLKLLTDRILERSMNIVDARYGHTENISLTHMTFGLMTDLEILRASVSSAALQPMSPEERQYRRDIAEWTLEPSVLLEIDTLEAFGWNTESSQRLLKSDSHILATGCHALDEGHPLTAYLALSLLHEPIRNQYGRLAIHVTDRLRYAGLFGVLIGACGCLGGALLLPRSRHAWRIA